MQKPLDEKPLFEGKKKTQLYNRRNRQYCRYKKKNRKLDIIEKSKQPFKRHKSEFGPKSDQSSFYAFI